MSFELKSILAEQERVRVQPVFGQWILKKDRLDRGCAILSKLSVDDLGVKNNGEKNDALDDFFLACASIDVSIHTYASSDNDRSMKRALMTWLTKHYTYSDLLVEQRVYHQFSEVARNVMFVEV